MTCYNEHGEELRRSLTAYARNVFMLQQVFGEKVWEEMPISIIIDGRAMASQAMLDFCQNELGVFSSEVGPALLLEPRGRLILYPPRSRPYT